MQVYPWIISTNVELYQPILKFMYNNPLQMACTKFNELTEMKKNDHNQGIII